MRVEKRCGYVVDHGHGLFGMGKPLVVLQRHWSCRYSLWCSALMWSMSMCIVRVLRVSAPQNLAIACVISIGSSLGKLGTTASSIAHSMSSLWGAAFGGQALYVAGRTTMVPVKAFARVAFIALSLLILYVSGPSAGDRAVGVSAIVRGASPGAFDGAGSNSWH